MNAVVAEQYFADKKESQKKAFSNLREGIYDKALRVLRDKIRAGASFEEVRASMLREFQSDFAPSKG